MEDTAFWHGASDATEFTCLSSSLTTTPVSVWSLSFPYSLPLLSLPISPAFLSFIPYRPYPESILSLLCPVSFYVLRWIAYTSRIWDGDSCAGYFSGKVLSEKGCERSRKDQRKKTRTGSQLDTAPAWSHWLLCERNCSTDRFYLEAKGPVFFSCIPTILALVAG
jgi:hypothetical protein